MSKTSLGHIQITYGRGEGLTKLSAFHSALVEAGIGDFNLIRLSSVIPKGASVEVRKFYGHSQLGNRMYVIIAEAQEQRKDREAWSGLGWLLPKEKNQAGFFVEHAGSSEKAVVNLIKKSIDSIAKTESMKNFKMGFKTLGIACKDKPVCSVVAAIYCQEDW